MAVASVSNVMQRYGDEAAFPLCGRLSPSPRFEHLGEQGRIVRQSSARPAYTTLPSGTRRRRALANALRRLIDAGVSLEGASDHGVSEALYLRDPDGNGIELSWDRPQAGWPLAEDGRLNMDTRPLSIKELLREARMTNRENRWRSLGANSRRSTGRETVIVVVYPRASQKTRPAEGCRGYAFVQIASTQIGPARTGDF